MEINFPPEMEARLREAAFDLTTTIEEFVLEAVERLLHDNEEDRMLLPTDPIELAEIRLRIADAWRRGIR